MRAVQPLGLRIATGSLTAGLVLAACGSSGTTGSSNPTGSSGSSAAAAAVAKYYAPLTNYALPGTKLTVGKMLQGKTVWYIPTGQVVVPLANVALRQALGLVGVNLRECDGMLTPSGASSCIDEAVNAKPDAIITNAIATDFAPRGYAKIQAAGIPLLYVNEPYPSAQGTDSMAYLTFDLSLAAIIGADWIIADSGGKANVLVNEFTDSAVTIDPVEKGLIPEFKSKCPACNVYLVKSSGATLAQLSSAFSAALVQHPDVQYAFATINAGISSIVQGIRSSGKIDTIKVVTTNGGLSALQSIASSGSGGIKADIENGTLWLLGWYMADQVVRMLSGAPVVQNEALPTRVFDSTDIQGLPLTQDAAQSATWFGFDLNKVFSNAWGVG